MLRRPPRPTRTDTPFPSATPFRSPRSRPMPAADDERASLSAFRLAPALATPTRVSGVRQLRNDALQAHAADMRQQVRRRRDDMIAVADLPAAPSEDGPEPLISGPQRMQPQIVPIMPPHVEGVTMKRERQIPRA